MPRSIKPGCGVSPAPVGILPRKTGGPPCVIGTKIAKLKTEQISKLN